MKFCIILLSVLICPCYGCVCVCVGSVNGNSLKLHVGGGFYPVGTGVLVHCGSLVVKCSAASVHTGASLPIDDYILGQFKIMYNQCQW